MPIWVMVDYFPVQTMKLDWIRPARTDLVLNDSQSHCGAGLYFPYIGASGIPVEIFEVYSAIQQMRRTSCIQGNYTYASASDSRLVEQFGTVAFTQNPQEVSQKIIKYLQCSHSEWIVFRPIVSSEIRQLICSTLGWQPVAADACRAPQVSPENPKVEECLH
jgi:hypothetical protein